VLTLQDIKQDPVFQTLIERSGSYLKTGVIPNTGCATSPLLRKRPPPSWTSSVSTSARWNSRPSPATSMMWANLVNRKDHGITGAILVYQELRRMGMDVEEICTVTSAIGNHEEANGRAVGPVSAAVILADKSDAHRTRANRLEDDRRPGIHDRVNLAITDSKLYVDKQERTITLEISFDQTICQIMDFFEIYLTRMEMCKEASSVLGCRFRLVINGLEFLGNLSLRHS